MDKDQVEQLMLSASKGDMNAQYALGQYYEGLNNEDDFTSKDLKQTDEYDNLNMSSSPFDMKTLKDVTVPSSAQTTAASSSSSSNSSSSSALATPAPPSPIVGGAATSSSSSSSSSPASSSLNKLKNSPCQVDKKTVKEEKSDKEQVAISVRIPSGQFIPALKISDQVQQINKEGNLMDNLKTFRLASVHKNLNVDNGNTVLANLRIRFLTKSGKEVEHTVPILVVGDDDKEVHIYSASQIDKKEFSEFYKSIRKAVENIEPKDHYHSEPFLAYYLCSEKGKDSIASKFRMKGLTVLAKDEEYPKTNVKCILGISIDLHSTKVICFNCAPFLRDATPKLLEAIYSALALGNLPEKDRLTKIDFNISANANFDFRNVQNAIFPHLPVLQGQESILVNTENILGEAKSNLQKIGELSNRTVFRSGSSTLNESVEKLIAQDKNNWEKIQKDAGVKILKAWRKYKGKDIIALQDGIKKIDLSVNDKKQSAKLVVSSPSSSSSSPSNGGGAQPMPTPASTPAAATRKPPGKAATPEAKEVKRLPVTPGK